MVLAINEKQLKKANKKIWNTKVDYELSRVHSK